MSWHFSRVLVGEYLVANSLDGELSAQLKSKPIPLAFLCKDRMKDFSRRSLSGMTFALLTENRGKELLTWFLAGFRVKTLVRPAKEKGLKENEAVYGQSLLASSAKYDRDSHSWKIVLCLQDEDSGLFSETWPKWGTMRNGVCSEGLTAEHLISENEYGFLPTPLADDWKGGLRGNTKTLRDWWAEHGWGKSPSQRHPVFWEWVMGWPEGWTELKQWEMGKFQLWLQQHGVFCKTASVAKSRS
jgi:hypothetical protein